MASTPASTGQRIDDVETVGAFASDLSPGDHIFDTFYGDWLTVVTIADVRLELPGGPAVDRLRIRFAHRDFSVRRDVNPAERFTLAVAA